MELFNTWHEKDKVRIIEIERTRGLYDPCKLPFTQWKPAIAFEKAQNVQKTIKNTILSFKQLREDKAEQKIKELKSKIKKHPENAMLYNKLGIIYARLNSTREAKTMFEKAIELNPKQSSQAYNNLANLCCENLKDAEEYYKKAIRQNPEDSKIYYNLGLNYLAQAKDVQEELNKIGPEAPRVQIQKLQEQRVSLEEKAIKAFEKSIEKSKHKNVGEFLSSLGFEPLKKERNISKPREFLKGQIKDLLKKIWKKIKEHLDRDEEAKKQTNKIITIWSGQRGERGLAVTLEELVNWEGEWVFEE
jgi:tetratricopeptide (TPR) repeat protein